MDWREFGAVTFEKQAQSSVLQRIAPVLVASRRLAKAVFLVLPILIIN